MGNGMRGVRWTRVGAVLGALLVTGCEKEAPAGSPAASASASAGAGSATGSAAPAGAFGREQVAADVAAATAAAGMGRPGTAVTAAPSPTDPGTAKGDLRAAMLACAVPWQTMEPLPDPVKAYEATITTLEQRGWKRGDRHQQDMLTHTSLTKQGWTVLARRYDFSAGKGSPMGMPDMLSFMATDQACEGRFTDAEMEEAFRDEDPQG
ncbi:hypothetical protein ACFWCB_21515 [Streptomyces sp. NPDC060048]|uniref:hypothetical protein n=1 Tax=unclassified Streptomyces TaxID=2593676 RepID=UPI0036A860E3